MQMLPTSLVRLVLRSLSAAALCVGITAQAQLASPTSIPNLEAWFDASQGVVKNGSNQVSTWADSSGKSRTATANNTSVVWVPGVLGGKPVLRFPGSGGSYLSVGNNPSWNKNTIITVLKNSTGNNTWPQYAAALESSNGGTRLGTFFEGTAFWNGGFVPSVVRRNGKALSSSNNYDLSPTQEFAILTMQPSRPSQGDTNAVRIGASDVPGVMNGDIAEIIVYSRTLTTAEMSSVEAYLADKYSVYHPSAQWITTLPPVIQSAVQSGILNQQAATSLAAIQGLGSGISGYWAINEGYGTTTADSAGLNPLTLVNFAGNASSGWTTGGKRGNALNFSHAVNNYAVAGSATALDAPAALTLSLWVKFTSLPSGGNTFTLISKNESGGYGLVANSASSGKLETSFYINGTNVAVGENLSNLAINTWYHVAATFDGSTVKYYRDGNLVSSADAAGAISSAAVPLTVGANPAANGTFVDTFDGTLDEVQFYSRALALSEIQALTASTTTSQPVPVSGLQSWYRPESLPVGLANGDKIPTWNDSLGRYNATQATTALQPTYVSSGPNGKPAVSFLSQHFESMLYTRPKGSVVYVIKASATTWAGYSSIFDTANSYRMGNFFNPGTTSFYVGDSASSVRRNGTVLTTPFDLAPISSGYMIVQVNLHARGLDPANNYVYIGRSDAGLSNLGNVAELMVYDHQLTTAEATTVEAYLANKYGIYHPSASWVTSYSPAMQAAIVTNGWTKAQADSYATFAAASPTVSLTGLLALWRAEDIQSTAGSAVSTWVDATNNYTLSQQTVSSQPTIQANVLGTNSGVRFSNSNSISSNLTYGGMASPLTFTVVYNLTDSIGPSNRVTSFNGGGGDFFLSSRNNVYDAYSGGWLTNTSGIRYQANKYVIHTYKQDTATNTQSHYLWGSLAGTRTGSTSVTNFALGNVSGEGFNGNIVAVYVYNTALSDSARNTLESALADKYGIYHPSAQWLTTGGYSAGILTKIAAERLPKAQADQLKAIEATGVTFDSNTTKLLAWWRASDVTAANGASVGNWLDATGQFWGFQGTVAAQPTYIATSAANQGKPSLRFDASSSAMPTQLDWQNSSRSASVIAVYASRDTTLTYRRVINFGGSFLMGPRTDNSGTYSTYSNSWMGTPAVPAYGMGKYVIQSYVQDTVANTRTAFLNNAQVGSLTGSITLGNFGFGNLAGEYANADVSEVMIFDRALTNAERSYWELYLANKYGLYHPSATWISAGSYTASQITAINTNKLTKYEADQYKATPAPIPGMSTTAGQTPTLHLRSDATIIYDGANSVLQWQDSSGNDNHATQSTHSSRPTLIPSALLGYPAIRTGTGGGITYLKTLSTVIPANTSYSIFAVVGRGSGDSWFLGDANGGNTNSALHIGFQGSTLAWRQYSNDFGPNVPQYTDRSFGLIELIADASGVKSVFTNGVSRGTYANTTMMAANNQMLIGSILNGGYSANNTDFLEVIVYPRAVSPAERTTIEAYITAKYFPTFSGTVSATTSGGGTGGAVSPLGTYTLGGYNTLYSFPVAASAYPGYSFPGWTGTGAAGLTNASSAQTTFSISGDAQSITTQFVPQTNATLTVNLGPDATATSTGQWRLGTAGQSVRVEGEAFATTSGTSGNYIDGRAHWIANGQYAQYTVTGLAAGTYQVVARYSTDSNSTSMVRSFTNGVSTLLTLPSTGSSNIFSTFASPVLVTLPSGTSTFRFEVQQNAGIVVNYFDLVPQVSTWGGWNVSGATLNLAPGYYVLEPQNFAGHSAPQSNLLMAGANQTVTLNYTVGLQPSSLSGLAVWLKADAIAASNGANVSAWPDSSGGNVAATQGTVGSQPTYQATGYAGKPTVRFSGAQGMTITGDVASNSRTYLAVFSHDPAAVGATRTVSGSANWLIGYYGGNLAMYAGNWVGSAYTPVASNMLYTTALTQIAGTSSTFYVNGVSQGTSSASNTPGNLFIGGLGGSNSEPMRGDIAEVIIYNRVLSAEELSNIHLYLADKYELYHPNAVWITGYTQTQQNVIHAGRLTKKEIDALIAVGFAANPPTIAGVTGSPGLWLMADGPMTTSGGLVTKWYDITGNHNLTLNSGSGPALIAASQTIINRPALRFSGQSFLSSKAVIHSNTPYTILVAEGRNSAGTSSWLGTTGVQGGGAASDQAMRFGFRGSNTWGLDQWSNVNAFYPATLPSFTTRLYNVYAAVASSTGKAVYLNGTVQGSNTDTTLLKQDATMYIGTGPQGDPYTGDILEIMIYNRALSAAEVASAQAYLDAKWFPRYNINVVAAPANSGTILPSITTYGGPNLTYTYGMTANAATGWNFSSWSGSSLSMLTNTAVAVPPMSATGTVTLNGDLNLIANFIPPPPISIKITLLPDTVQTDAKWRLLQGNSVITAWGKSGDTVTNIAAGNYSVECSYLPGYTTPTATLTANGSNLAQTLTYATYAASFSATNTGLAFNYFNSGSDLYADYSAMSPGSTGTWPDINLPSGTVDALLATVGKTAGNAHLVFSGEIYFPSAGTWTMYSNSDDHSKIFIGPAGNTSTSTQTLVVDRPCCGESSGTYTVAAAGWYPITVQWQNGGGGYYLYVSMSATGYAKQVVPTANFRYTTTVPLDAWGQTPKTWNAGPDMATHMAGANASSSSNNEVPEWSYGFVASSSNPAFTSFVPADYGTDAWGFLGFRRSGNNYPKIVVSPDNAARSGNSGKPNPANALWVAPYNNGNSPALRWVAPAAGLYTINSNWVYNELPTCGDGYSAQVWSNGNSLYSVNAGFGTSSFVQNLQLAAGDVLLIATGMNGGYACDDVALTVTIQKAQFTLTVNAGANGTVTPQGTSSLTIGTAFHLQATPNANYAFSGWNVSAGFAAFDDIGSASTNIYIGSATTVTPVFVASNATLTVAVVGSGTVTPPSGNYTLGGFAILTATPDANNYFAGWTGPDVSSLPDASAATTRVFFDASKSLVANFIAGINGDITINLAPSAVGAVVRWQLTNPSYTSAWSNSGGTVPSVPPGTYTILFDRQRLDDGNGVFLAPSNPTVLVGGFPTITKQVTFTEQSAIKAMNGLIYWLKPETLSGPPGSYLDTWVNSTGGGNDAYQGIGARQPTITAPDALSIYPSLRFSGAQYLQTPFNVFLASTPKTVFVVAQRQASSNGVLIGNDTNVGDTYGGQGFMLQVNSATSFRYFWSTGGSSWAASATLPAYSASEPFRYYSATQSATAGTALYLNGSSVAVNAANYLPAYNRLLRVGWGEGFEYFNGNIAEVIIFNRALAGTELDALHVYLARKYSPPNYTVSVSSGTGGTVTGGGSYRENARATLQATANPGYAFSSWTLSIPTPSGVDLLQPTVILPINSAVTVTASFVPTTPSALRVTITPASIASQVNWRIYLSGQESSGQVSGATLSSLSAGTYAVKLDPAIVSDGTTSYSSPELTVTLGNGTTEVTAAYLPVRTPTTVAGLTYWLKPESLPKEATGFLLDTWANTLGGNDAYQGLASYLPSLSNDAINSYPAVKFNGASFLQTPSSVFPAATARTMFVVAQRSSGANGVLIGNETNVGDTYGGQGTMFQFNSGTNFRYFWSNGGSSYEATATLPTWVPGEAFRIYSATHNTAGGSAYLNGVAKGYAVSSSTFPSYPRLLRVGHSPNFDYFNGNIAEVLIYSRALSPSERQTVEAYLNAKYFTPAQYLLTAATDGNGTVTGSGSYAANTLVTVTATPSAGFSFVNWTGVNAGDLSGQAASTTTLRMNAAKYIKANFVPLANSDVTITVTPASISSQVQWRIIVAGEESVATASGGTLSNVPPGTYAVSFNPATVLDGGLTYAAPALSITVGSGPLSITATYQAVAQPSDLSGLAYWLKPESLPNEASGFPLDTWTNALGSNPAVQSAGTLQPTLVTNAINAYPAVRFNNTFLQTADSVLPASTARSIFIVAQRLSGANGVLLGSNSNVGDTYGGQGTMFQFNSGTNFRYFWSSGGSSFEATATLPTYATGESFRIYSVIHGAAGASLLVDNMAKSSTTAVGLPAYARPLRVGHSNSFEYFNGNIAEVIIYNRVLSATERQGVESYLTAKFFTPKQVGLTVYTDGHGTVTPGSGAYNLGSRVTLMATPANGYAFDSWGLSDANGLVPVTSRIATMVMNGAKVVKANFTPVATSSSLSVTIAPAAIAPTVQWAILINGTPSAWQASGATLTGVPVGEYVVSFSPAATTANNLAYSAPNTVVSVGAAPRSITALFSSRPLPAGITNMLAWYKAETATTSDWTDSSPNGYHMTRVSGAAPTTVANGINGQPVVRFSGAQYYRTNIETPVGGSPLTIFMVEGRTAGGNNQTIAFQGNPSSETGFVLGFDSSSTVGTSWRDSNTKRDLYATIPTYSSQQFAYTTLVSYPNGQNLYRNGNAFASGSFPGPSLASNRYFYIGGAYTTNFTGDVAEVLIYNRALSTAERLAVEGYLNTKYFLPPQYTLTVTCNAGGTVTPFGTSTYSQGEAVTLTAVPATNYAFVNWTGPDAARLSSTTTTSPTITLGSAAQVQANFAPITRSLTVTAGSGGDAAPTGTSTVEQGSPFSLTATASIGYIFTNWTVTSGTATIAATSNASTTVTLNSADATIQANFITKNYNLTVNTVNGTVAQTVTSYPANSTQTAAATPLANYTFDVWSGADAANLSSTSNANPTIVMTADRIVTANFIPLYTLTVNRNITAGGTVTPASGTTSGAGRSLSLVATPATNYSFVNWTGNVVNANSASTSILMSGNQTVTANFVAHTFNLVVTANPVAGGVINPTGSNAYIVGSSVPLVATPNTGYVFGSWLTLSGASAASANSATTSTVLTADTALQANFLKLYALKLTTTTGGTVSPTTSQQAETALVTITATPATGYRFDRWTGDTQSLVTAVTNPGGLLTMPAADANLQATFVALSFTLTMTAQTGGTVTPTAGDHTYVVGSSATVTAVPSAGYAFTGWTGDANFLTNAAAATQTFTVMQDMALTATFTPTYVLTTASSEGGTVSPASGGHTYNSGSVITLTATPAAHYAFVNWTGTGAGALDNVNSATASLTLTANLSVVANFQPVSYTLTATSGPGGSVWPATRNYADPSTSIAYPYNTVVPIVAIPASSYLFDHWSGDTAALTSTPGTTARAAAGGITVTATAVWNAATSKWDCSWSVGPMTSSGGAINQGVRGQASIYTTGVYTPLVEVVNLAGYTESGSSSVALAPDQQIYVRAQILDNGSSPTTVASFQLAKTASTGTVVTTTIARDTAVMAHFIQGYSITVSSGANGNTDVSGTGLYPAGSVLTVHATPAAGYRFSTWTGSLAAGLADATSATAAIPVNQNGTLSAQFTLAVYTLTTVAGTGGSVTPDGSNQYSMGRTISLLAQPATGFMFDRWTGTSVAQLSSSTVPNPTITINGDYSVAADFVLKRTLLLTATSGGSVTPTSPNIVRDGTVLTLTATPASGYVFTGWAGANAADLSGTGTSVTLSMNGDKSIQATFTPVQHSLTVSATAGGTTSPSGVTQHNEGTTLTLTATPATGYSFGYWSGPSSLSLTPAQVANPALSVTMASDRSFTANFGLNRILNVTATAGGTVNPVGNHTYADGTIVTLTATTGANALFAGWTGANAGDLSSNNATTSIVMDGDKTLVAGFTAITQVVTFAATAGGSVSPSGAQTYTRGTSIAATATPAAGYVFTAWTGASQETNPSINIIVDTDKAYTAHFAIRRMLTVTSTPGGTIAPSGTTLYADGSTVTFSVTPAPNYTFTGWTGANVGELSNTSTTPTLTMDGDKQIGVTFAPITRNFSLVASGNGVVSAKVNGVVVATGGQSVQLPQGSTLSIEAVPGAGHILSQWTGASLATSSPVSLTLSADTTITGVFIPGFTLTTNAGVGGTIAPSGTTTAPTGTVVSVVATASTGYNFDHWSGTAAVGLPGTANISVTITADATLRAEFVEAYWNVTLSAGTNGTVTPSGSQTFRQGDMVSVTATPTAGYVFKQWQGDTQVLTSNGLFSPQINFVVARNTSLTASFAVARTLTTAATNGGQVTPAGTQVVPDGAVVQVSAPATYNGRTFTAWGGDTAGLVVGSNGLSLQVVMDQDRVINALFSQAQARLTITSVGAGTTNPAGLVIVLQQTPVDIAVNAQDGSMFVGASLNGNGDLAQFDAVALSNGILRNSYTADTAVVATFTPYHNLTIDSRGSGKVTVTATLAGRALYEFYKGRQVFDINGVSSRRFPAVASLQFLAEPAAFWVFDHFEGADVADLSSAASSAPTMSGVATDKALTAIFRLPKFTLNVSSAGNGLVSPSGTNSYDAGTTVSLVAQPDPGYVFAGWTGASSQHDNPVDFTVASTSSRTVVANFTPGIVLTIGASSGGTVSPGLGAITYSANTTVVVTANPANGYKFDHWTGSGVPAGQDTAKQLVLTLTGTVQLFAVFSPLTLDVNIAAGIHGAVVPAGTVTLSSSQTLAVQATPDEGYAFAGWDGTAAAVMTSVQRASGIVLFTPGNSTLPSPLELHANFLPAVQLTTTSTGLGHLEYSVSGASAFQPLSGTVSVVSGQAYDVRAVPDSTNRFGSWTGDAVATSGSTFTFTATTGRVFGANFVSRLHKIVVQGSSGGNISPSGTNLIQHGSSYTVNASPDANSVFVGWDVQEDTGGLDDTSPITTNLSSSQVSSSPSSSKQAQPSYSFSVLSNMAFSAVFAPKATLTVTSSSYGSVSADGYGTCVPQLTLPLGTVLVLRPAAVYGYRFDHWEGADAASITQGAVWRLTMSQDRAITPVFVRIPYLEVVVQAGTALIEGTGLTVTSGVSGASTSYMVTGPSNQLVSVTAVPAAFAQFGNWTGVAMSPNDVLGTSHTAQISLVDTKRITAHMSTPKITVNLGNNVEYSTSLSPTATFIRAPAVSVAVGSLLQVRAVTSASTAFAGWTGDTSYLSTHGSPAVLTAARALSINATVTGQTATLTVFLIGGSQDSYTVTVPQGQYVALTPVLALLGTGNTFARWAGLDVGSLVSLATNPATDMSAGITLSSNKQLTAIFAPSYSLNVTVSGNGTVNNFGLTTWQQGTVATITPIPTPGFIFTGWTGVNATEVSPEAKLTMDSPKVVQANFAPATYTVTITTTNGTVPSVTYTFGANTLVSLSGAMVSSLAAPGYLFASWTGADANLLANPANPSGTILLTHNSSLHLNFAAALNLGVSASSGGTITVEKVPAKP